MPGDFVEKLGAIQARVGEGLLIGRVEFDQVYAHRQHEDLMFKHPRGGGAKYLEKPLLEQSSFYMELIAEHILEEGSAAMIEVVEDLGRRASDAAPILFGFLRGSDHPSVESNGAMIYDRPPVQARLSEAEIEFLNENFLPKQHYYTDRDRRA